MRKLLRFGFSFVLLAACAVQAINPTPTQPAPTSLPSTAAEAQDVLIDFLTLLHTKKYAEAAPLYGGEYEQLQVFNTEIDSNDHMALWAWACDNQLLQCLEVRSTAFESLEGDTYVFQVEFNNPDGSLFVLGPCCGANETEMPPQSRYADYIKGYSCRIQFASIAARSKRIDRCSQLSFRARNCIYAHTACLS